MLGHLPPELRHRLSFITANGLNFDWTHRETTLELYAPWS